MKQKDKQFSENSNHKEIGTMYVHELILKYSKYIISKTN